MTPHSPSFRASQPRNRGINHGVPSFADTGCENRDAKRGESLASLRDPAGRGLCSAGRGLLLAVQSPHSCTAKENAK